MEGRTCFLCFVAALCLAAPALTKETMTYFADGDTLTLTLSKPQAIKRILWKVGGNLVAEWLGDSDFEYYGRFKNRTTLQQTTGELKIKNMSLDDQGLFTVEINSVALDEQFKAERLERVPRPEVAPQPLSCDLPSFTCNLTCTGKEPGKVDVTYSWKKGDGEWEVGKRLLPLNQELKGTKELTCRMKNPVSEETSQPYPNPIYSETGGSNGGVIAGVLVFLFLAGGTGLAWLGYKNKDKLRNFVLSGQSGNNNGTRQGDGQLDGQPGAQSSLMDSAGGEKDGGDK